MSSLKVKSSSMSLVVEVVGKCSEKYGFKAEEALELFIAESKPSRSNEGKKGRPKKEKKVIEIEGSGEDLFASLVADASREEETENIEKSEKIVKKEALEQEKALKKAALEQEKAAKAEAKAALEQEKAAKKAALEQEKAAKAEAKAALEQEKVAKAEAKAALEQEKAAKKAALEQEKAAKKAAKEEKAAKKEKAPKKAAPKKEESEETEVVKKIEVDGKKYLKSKNTGVIYDYAEYTSTGEQVVVGKWNETSNTIDFQKGNDEECEEEYDE